MEQFTRLCPQCDIVLQYTSANNRNKAEKKKRLCSKCSAKNRIAKYGLHTALIKNQEKGVFAGEKNPFYGKTHSKETIEKIKANRDTSFTQTEEYKENNVLIHQAPTTPCMEKPCIKFGLKNMDKKKQINY